MGSLSVTEFLINGLAGIIIELAGLVADLVAQAGFNKWVAENIDFSTNIYAKPETE